MIDKKGSGSGVTRTVRWPKAGQPLTKRHGISLPAPAGVDTRLLAALRRGNDMISLWRSLRHRFHYRLCEAVSAEQIRHFKDYRRSANVYLTLTETPIDVNIFFYHYIIVINQIFDVLVNRNIIEPINDYTSFLLTEIWIRPTITYGLVVCFVTEPESDS